MGQYQYKRGMKLNAVDFHFDSDALWRGRGEALAHLLYSYEIFRPVRWGPSEPVRRPFTPEVFPQIAQLWDKHHGLMFKRPQKPKFGIDSWWFTNLPHAPAAQLWGSVEERFFKKEENIQAFLALTKDLFAWGNMLYGYACHRADYEAKNGYQAVEDWGGGVKMLAEGAWATNLYECLPGIYWANFFGKLFVDWFGRERMLSAPCYHCEELSGGGILLLTAPSPLDYDKPEVKELERALRKHLGEDAFFTREDPERPCKTPPFPKREKGAPPKKG